MEAVIKKLNYTPNSSALNLRQGKTHTIGVIVPFINHPFFSNRLISIILLLQSQGQMTKELSERLEVSERTFYRDMDALSGIGIPVSQSVEKNAGWSLLGGYRTNLTGLKESEIRALFVSTSAQLLDDLGLTLTSEKPGINL